MTKQQFRLIIGFLYMILQVLPMTKEAREAADELMSQANDYLLQMRD